MASRYRTPETCQLTISQGDTLTVWKRLTHGARQASYNRRYKADGAGSLALNTLQVGLSTVTAYLLDWSLVGLDGKQVVIRDQPIEVVEAALNNLPPEDFDEIHEAIQAHEKAMLAERNAEKNGQSGNSSDGATSLSLVGATGASSGSAN